MTGRGVAGWILTVAALAATACTTHREKAEWKVDNFLAVEHPDSARRLLQRIDPEQLNRDDRARCAFRGRNYEAWYAPEIAVSAGPWKFGGLPGLILAIKDDAGVLDLEATGVEQRVEPIRMTDRNYMKTNRKKYRELKQKIMTDPVGYLTGNSNVQMTIKNEDGSPVNPGDLVRGYNPIELE